MYKAFERAYDGVVRIQIFSIQFILLSLHPGNCTVFSADKANNGLILRELGNNKTNR